MLLSLSSVTRYSSSKGGPKATLLLIGAIWLIIMSPIILPILWGYQFIVEGKQQKGVVNFAEWTRTGQHYLWFAQITCPTTLTLSLTDRYKHSAKLKAIFQDTINTEFSLLNTEEHFEGTVSNTAVQGAKFPLPCLTFTKRCAERKTAPQPNFLLTF